MDLLMLSHSYFTIRHRNSDQVVEGGVKLSSYT